MSGKTGNNSRVRLAIIGCGAVTEICHLPAAKLTPEVDIVALVDKNIARAESLGERLGVAFRTDDYRNLPDAVDGVIVALPHYLLAPVSIEFLQRGIPVLVEKPMALNLKEAEALVKAAADNNVALQVGLKFHFCEGTRLVKRAVAEGWLGALSRFELEWGFVYSWPVASGFFFSKEQAGGGVLIDLGSHVLDLLLWWLGDAVNVEYRDDSQGGIEAECELSLVMQGPTGLVPGTVALSRLRQLNDMARIVGEHFTLECDLAVPASVRIWPNTSDGKDVTFELSGGASPRQSWDEAYAAQLRAFARTISTGDAPAVSGEQVLSGMALLERCYRERQPLELPWMQPATSQRELAPV